MDIKKKQKFERGVGWLFPFIQFKSNLEPIDKDMSYIDSFQISKKSWLPGKLFEWSQLEKKTSPLHTPTSLGNVANLPDHFLLKFERNESVNKS